MKKIRMFTRDSMVRRISRVLGERIKPTTKDANPERKPVDLNEIHRRFWARLAGKE